MKDLLYGWGALVYFGTQRIIPNARDSAILHPSNFVLFLRFTISGRESESLGKQNYCTVLLLRQ